MVGEALYGAVTEISLLYPSINPSASPQCALKHLKAAGRPLQIMPMLTPCSNFYIAVKSF